VALVPSDILGGSALTLEYVVGKQMLALALMKDLAALLVVVLDDEHLVEEISIIVLLLASTNRGRVILYDLLVFNLHQFLSALQDCASARE